MYIFFVSKEESVFPSCELKTTKAKKNSSSRKGPSVFTFYLKRNLTHHESIQTSPHAVLPANQSDSPTERWRTRTAIKNCCRRHRSAKDSKRLRSSEILCLGLSSSLSPLGFERKKGLNKVDIIFLIFECIFLIFCTKENITTPPFFFF